MNWPRGLTRIYYVAWAVWILVLLNWSGGGNDLEARILRLIFGVGFYGGVLPYALLRVIRWIVAGFLAK